MIGLFPKKRQRGGWTHGHAGFVCYLHPSPCITKQELGFGFWDCFAEYQNTNMTWMRNVLCSSVVKKCGMLVVFTLARCMRKHLSPLSSAKIRRLYLFRAAAINTEWGIVGQTEGKERERWWKEEKNVDAALFVIGCASVGADGINPCWSQENGGWPPPCHSPPSSTQLRQHAAVFPAFTCPFPPLIPPCHEAAWCYLMAIIPPWDGASSVQSISLQGEEWSQEGGLQKRKHK